MSLILLIFYLLILSSVGFDRSLELVECGLDGHMSRLLGVDGVCCTLVVALTFDDGVTC